MFLLFGSFLIIILGIILSNSIAPTWGSLQYENGSMSLISGNTTIVSTQYATYSNSILGLFLTLYGIFSFVIVLLNNRND